MITVVLSIIAKSMAKKGKRSKAIMLVYTIVMSIIYFFFLVGIYNSEDKHKTIFFAINYMLLLYLCIETIIKTKIIVEKSNKI